MAIIDINEALCVYLGADLAGGYDPIGDHDERLRTVYGERYQEIKSLILPYLDAPDPPLSDWSSGDLAQESASYLNKLRVMFPELNERALKALANRWSFDWK